METEEFLNHLQHFSLMRDASVLVFFLLKEGNCLLKKADFCDDATAAVYNSLRDRLTSLHVQYSQHPDFLVKNLSDADDRQSVAYIYDVEHELEVLSFMDEIDTHNEIDYFTGSRVYNFTEEKNQQM